jgi:N-acetylglucosamine-6-phosphate deacetylase
MPAWFVDRLVNPDGVLERCEIKVEGDRIVSVTPAARSAGADSTAGSDRSPAHHAPLAVPGFIDIHTHGGAGHDLMDQSDTGLPEIAEHHLRNGTTSFVCSTLTAALPALDAVLEWVRGRLPETREAAAAGRAADLLGIHVEGPWISPARAGAQNPAYMHAPNDEAESFIRRHADTIRMVTFSYHYPSSTDFLDLLNELGIIAASGHDETTDERILEGFARGLRHVTHIYSMTSAFQRVDGRKHLGTLEMALMTPGVTVEVIADGRHITEHFWRFITHNKSVDDIMIVSDSMRWAGMPSDPDAVIRVGEHAVVVDDGVAWLADRSAFAGSITNMHAEFVRLVREWGVPLVDAVRMTSWNQAVKLGVSADTGSIAPGKRADFILLEDDLSLAAVVKSGRPVAR